MADLGGGQFGPPEAPGGGVSGLKGASNLSMGFAIAGAVSSAIGAFYSVKMAQYQAKSQALNLEFQANMATFNARGAELDAQYTMLAGQKQAGQVGLQYRQLKSTTKARRGAAGVEGGVGSAAEIDASIDYSKETDIASITMNTVRAANARRMQGVGMGIQARMARMSASNLRHTAGSMNAGLAGFTSLLGGATGVAKAYAQTQRDEQRYRYQKGLS